MMVTVFWRTLLILTLVFQPTLLSGVTALAAFGDAMTPCPRSGATTCCASDAASMTGASCCGGPGFCTCATPQPDEPLAPPIRNISVDQVFAALQLPTGTVEPAPTPINEHVPSMGLQMPHSAQAVCAMLCIWRT